MSDLRTRIAAVLAAESERRYLPINPKYAQDMADAVIRELGLRQESEYIDLDDGHAGGYPHQHHRYVTEWENQ